MKLFKGIYKNRRVVVTGHTGFKGSWLSLWLHEMGAKVTGIALPPSTNPNHWSLLKTDIEDIQLDIRDSVSLREAITNANPEIIFHLAAQPLVRYSYQHPLDTWSTNVMGTANLLDACRDLNDLKAVLVVTSDKCYQNNEWPWGYRELDRLGGHDPYSASKAGSELVVASYRDAFFNTADAAFLASARAGNVIGGGDWSEDRLIPDLVRAVDSNNSLEIRSPDATRPWQHVLESLSGYLLLGQKLFERKSEFASAWNFGPEPEGNKTVADVLGRLNQHWPQMNWHVTTNPQPHEANLLYLDSAKARSQLKWQPVWQIDQALTATTHWYRAWLERNQVESSAQLKEYIDTAKQAGISWTDE